MVLSGCSNSGIEFPNGYTQGVRDIDSVGRVNNRVTADNPVHASRFQLVIGALRKERVNADSDDVGKSSMPKLQCRGLHGSGSRDDIVDQDRRVARPLPRMSDRYADVVISQAGLFQQQIRRLRAIRDCRHPLFTLAVRSDDNWFSHMGPHPVSYIRARMGDGSLDWIDFRETFSPMEMRIHRDKPVEIDAQLLRKIL